MTPVREEKLSAVLSDLARTLLTDFPIQAILDHLVRRIVDVLPVTAAGVTLISPSHGPQYVAASDPSALRYEKLQSDLGEGPCIAAYTSGEAISVPDIDAEDRFPLFATEALAAGLRAVFTFPLRHGDERIGALDLYRHSPGPLDEWEESAAQTLADVATAYLLNAQARESANDISEQFRLSGLHDALTGLPNRVLLQDRLRHVAARSQRSHANAAVLFADLDRFKAVNDAHGHLVGDQLLVAVGRRLSGLVRVGDTLARVSGDEFVVLCEDLQDTDDAISVAQRITAAFDEPFLVEGACITLTASVGIAFAGSGDDLPRQLLQDADAAMYQAKRKGGARHQVLDASEQRRGIARIELVDDLRAAVRAGGLEVHYQPIVRPRDGRPVGAEALLRWDRPGHGPVSPQDVIEIAERHDLIDEIGAWVLQRACRDLHRFQPLSNWPVRMSVNVSAMQLMSERFPSTVREILAETSTAPTAIILEITEGVLLENIAEATGVLTELKQIGVELALDDFGTGYSSLGYLRALPVDILKIDRGFVAELGRDPAAATIIAAVVDLAHALGLSVTAEGVETGAQRELLNAMGCDLAQGYLFSRPAPADNIAALLTAAHDPEGAPSLDRVEGG